MGRKKLSPPPPRHQVKKEVSWNDFDKSKGSNQKLPPVKKYVACQMISLDNGFPDPIVIGYLKNAAGDIECPYFVTPGAIGHGEVYRWCDCINDDFKWPDERK